MTMLKMRYDDKSDATNTTDIDAKNGDHLYTQNNNEKEML